MIVADTSALISLASIDLLDTFLDEFEVHTTTLVAEELRTTADYEDRHGDAAERVLARLQQVSIHQMGSEFDSSRIDPGEGSCAALTRKNDAEFLITDDLRALPELQTVTDTRVAISPIVLKALVQRDVLARDRAREKLDELAGQRDWLGAPIYRRATALFTSK